MVDERIAAFPSRTVSVGGKNLAYRESGEGPALVLLHGIGSGSASWLFQLEDLANQYRVIAWDAPGYGESDAFSIEKPHPSDYARALSVLLSALQVKNFVLVGQSLGCLMAASYARMFPNHPRMVLISPASGFSGDHDKVQERLKSFDELGPDGLAEKRAGALLSPSPAPIALELVRWNWRRIRRDGYRQASYCLANGNIREDAAFYKGKTLVACGTADSVTPEPGCREIASKFSDATYQSLPGLGHASQVEGPGRVNDLLRKFAC
jgi:pimeloyl-ACP methyl ester carboxylesterase